VAIRSTVLFTLALAFALVASACSVTIGDGSGPHPSASPTDSSTVVVSAEGSGPSLGEALASVPDGGTIKLEAGTYLVETPIAVDKSIHLIGAGRAKTEIESTVAQTWLRVSAPTFEAEGITFRHSGSRAGGVLVVTDSEVRIVDCAFVGASRKPKWSFESLWLKGSSSGYVRDCVFEANAVGIGVSGKSRTSVEQCRFTLSGMAGIAVYGSARPRVSGNVCSKSNDSGILVFDSARPTLESNRCTTSQNGIVCGDRSSARVEDNRCSSNLNSGIVIYDHARASLVGNVCMGNRHNGITCTGSTQVRISGNTAERNKDVGIGCWGSVTGRVALNDVTRNGTGNSGGICVGGHANLLVEDNHCDFNKQYGILFRDSGTGTVRDNYCAHANYGILDNSSRSPNITGNDLEWNSKENIGRW